MIPHIRKLFDDKVKVKGSFWNTVLVMKYFCSRDGQYFKLSVFQHILRLALAKVHLLKVAGNLYYFVNCIRLF